MVIPPFLTGCGCRTYAAHFQFHGGCNAAAAHILAVRCPAVVCLQTMREGLGLQRRSPPFSTLPSPRAADGLACEGACSPSQRLHAVLTSGHRVDAVEPICSASKAQPLNLMKVEAALSHSSSPCAPHHAETRLCISLLFSISFIANIARKRPELNRDKTRHCCNPHTCRITVALTNRCMVVNCQLGWQARSPGSNKFAS